MMTIQGLNELQSRIEAEGIPPETANYYAGRIGGTPWVEDGKLLVKDRDGRTLATLPVRVLSNPPPDTE